jgi:hypothetical protein
MNAFGGMFAAAAAAGYQDPYRMAASLQDQTALAAHHHHHAAAAAAHHHHHHHHQYKVPRIYFKIPRVLPYKEQKEKFDTDDYFKKLQREGEVRRLSKLLHLKVSFKKIQNKCFSLLCFLKNHPFE